MSESAPEATGSETEQVEGQTPEGETPEGAEGTEQVDVAELQRQAAHWKAMARKQEGRAKENASAAARLKELEDANKTELQKAQDKASEAEQRAQAAEQRHFRVMAAAMHDLPVDMIDDLGAGTEDEITARAERWAGIIETRAQERANQILAGQNGVPQPGAGTGRPVESMRAGAAPAGGATPQTPDEFFRSLVQGN